MILYRYPIEYVQVTILIIKDILYTG
jgi:hypothetical protein